MSFIKSVSPYLSRVKINGYNLNPFFIRCLSILLFVLVINIESKAQCNQAGDPSCTCATAPVLCNIGELDGYTYSMSSYQHAWDGPDNPMCPGASGTSAHNPTWFAFIAWCTNLTLEVSFSGCNDNGPGFCAGLQAAVYSQCFSTWTGNEYQTAVTGGCNTGGGCNSASGSRILNLSGLIIGNTYYFLVDGCCGSACSTVTIDVIGTCGLGDISDWDQEIQGPEQVCLTQPMPIKYHLLDKHDGAVNYQWKIDGVVYAEGQGLLLEADMPGITFTTPGLHTVCVDVANLPCIAYTEFPPPLCKTICVAPEPANAGTIQVVSSPSCPGVPINVTVSGFNANPVFHQYVFVTDGSGNILQISNSNSLTFNHMECDNFMVYSYNYYCETDPPIVGMNVSELICEATDCTCELISADISFNDSTPPVFTDAPADVTFNCFINVPPFAPLAYTDNCLPAGSAVGMETGSSDMCAGGSITRTWEITDQCGNSVSHEQNITILPLPEAAFMNPPANITISCTTFAGFMDTNLNYSNGSNGTCLIAGSIIPTTTGTANSCGGQLTKTWTFTDVCNRTITHQQTITVEPTPQAVFINPPANITLNCNDLLSFIPQNLNYSNSSTGTCLIQGSATPTFNNNLGICGGSFTVTYNFTDVCGRAISHTQTVTALPSPPAAYSNVPADVTLECNNLITSPPDLPYTNGAIGGCSISGTSVGTILGTPNMCGGSYSFQWSHTDVCNREIEYTQDISVNPTPAPTWVNPPANITVNCDLIPTAGVPLQVINTAPAPCAVNTTVNPVQSGSGNICGGTIIYTWTFTDQCQHTITHVQTITITPIPLPAFVNPPANITVNCDQIPTAGVPLQVVNNAPAACNINTTVNPVQSGNGNICGGTITYTWTFTDQCQHTITHVQTITITPIPLPAFVNPPANITVNCDQIPTSSVPLQVVNNAPTACAVNAMVNPVQSGSATICGGTITYTWTFTDQCQNTITHVQNITVTPLPLPTFVNPPANITVNCDQIPTAGVPLQVINTAPAACAVNATVNPVQSGTATVCGGTITYTWTFTDQCQNTITHVQNIMVNPMPAPMFVSPPPSVTVTCENMPLTAIDLMVINNGPTACNINTTVSPALIGTPNACGGSYIFRWIYDGQCQDITYDQTITTTPPPQGTFQNPPSNVTVNCEQSPLPANFPNLTISNNLTGVCAVNASVTPVVTGIPANYCGGVITATWTHVDQCLRTTTYVQTVTVQPAPQATFSNVPPNITVNCSELDNTPIGLTASNNGNGSCLISASVNNVRTGNITYCGGVLFDTWTFTDLCGRSVFASRTITVNPAPPAVFTSLPADITVECADAGVVGSALDYSNGLSGQCAIIGQAQFNLIGTYNSCGGQLFGTWSFTDQCNRTISHIQTITVNPASDPDFINPPMDEDLGCGGDNLPPQFIIVSNGGLGNCAIEINAPLISITEDDGLFTNEWEYTHPCTNEVFTHTQTTATIPSPNLFTETPELIICAEQTFDLSTIVVEDLNDTDPEYTYHSAIPGDASNEVLPEVMPNEGDIYFIQGTNSYGCADAVTIYFLYGDAPMAGGDGSASLCNDGAVLNLNTLLNGNYDNNGSWVQTNGSNLNLTNPTSVNFLNVPAGNYNLSYIVESNSNNCPPAIANFVITVTNKITLNIASLDCVIGGAYEIKLTSNSSVVSSNLGTVQKLTLDTFRIFNIPQGQGVIITGSSSNGICTATISINAPNCDCPFIDISNGQTYYSQCENITTPIELNVTVPSGMQANWYNQPLGGTPILSNSLSYTHNNFTTGSYSYFVETFDPVTLCVSLTRLEIVVEILAVPQANNYTYVLCDVGNNGVEIFDLNSIHSNVTSLSNTVTYHISLSDANNDVNPLIISYSNISNPQTIYALVTASTGCKSIGQVSLNLNESPIPVIDKENESCFGSDNGSIVITNHNQAQGWQYSFDNVTFTSTSSFDDLEVNNYVLFSQNLNGCKASTPFTIEPGMIVNISNLVLECNNNGTLSDPNDDLYTVTINAENSLNLAGNYIVTIGGNTIGTYPYSVNSTFNLPANGGTVEIVVSDQVKQCNVKRTVGPLTSCSTDCIASLNILSTVCDDNSTPTDPTDDFYTITFDAQAQNGSSTNDYFLFIDAGLKGKFNYNSTNTITTPANNLLAIVRIQDSEDLQCSDSENIGPLTSCSNDCLINAVIESVNCFNPGDSPDPSDDYYEIVINAQLINGGTSTEYEVTISNGSPVNGIYNQPLTITLPADNSTPILTIVDNTRPECNDVINLPNLTPCSEPCVIDVQVTNIECDNAGTNETEDDDVYTFEIFVSGNNNKYIIDELNINGVVGNKQKLGPYKITEGIDNFVVYYESNPNCKKFITIQIPNACSSCNQTVDAGTGGEISCTTPEITLTATSSDPGTFTWELNGSIITTGLSIKVGQPGVYHFTAEYADGCFATDSVIVTIDANLPVVSVSRGHLLNCLIDEVTIMATATGNNLTYEWSNEVGDIISTGLSIDVTEAGKYYFRAFNTATGCSSSQVLSEVLLDEDIPSSVIYARPTSLIDCVIKTITLYNDAEDDVAYTWRLTNSDFFSNDKEIIIDKAGNYFLQAIDTISGCESESNLNITELIEYPIIFMDVDDTLDCVIESVFIDASGSQVGPDIVYKWKDKNKNVIGNSTGGFAVTEPGTYYLELSNIVNGCTNEDTVNVEIFENEINIDLPVSINIEEGATYQFNTQVNIPESDIKSITWSPSEKLSCSDCLNPTLLVTEDGEYVVTVEDIFGCKGIAAIRINSVKFEVINIPNIISIESGTNNGFTLYGNDQVQIINSLRIFDRWGNLMFVRKNFAPNDPSLGWNGKINGKHVEQGVYVYVFDINLLSETNKIFKGDITVIR